MLTKIFHSGILPLTSEKYSILFLPFIRALACIWLIYGDKKIPHLKGEPYMGNSSYVPIYTNYIPTEFLINGIVSALLVLLQLASTSRVIGTDSELFSPFADCRERDLYFYNGNNNS